MAGILFEDIFDVKDIDPEGKKFDRGEWGPGAARPPGPGCSLPGSSPGLRRLRPERLGAALPRRGGLLPSLSPACPAPPPLPFPPVGAPAPSPSSGTDPTVCCRTPVRPASPGRLMCPSTPPRPRYAPFPIPPCSSPCLCAP